MRFGKPGATPNIKIHDCSGPAHWIDLDWKRTTIVQRWGWINRIGTITLIII
jgi:hypothetical protein